MRKSAGRFASREGQRMRSAGLGQVLPTRKRDFKVVSAVNTAQRVQDAVKVGLDCGPTRSWQNKDGQLSYREVLLIAQVLVRGNEHIESFFCSSQEISIAQIRPSHFERSGDGMTAQDFAQWDRSALIEEDSQCVWFSFRPGSRLDQTVFSVLQHSDDLFVRDTRKPFQEVVHAGPTLEVLEQCTHRDAGSLEHPGPTDLSGNALDGAALTPVQHRRHCSWLTNRRARVRTRCRVRRPCHEIRFRRCLAKLLPRPAQARTCQF